SHLHIIVCTDDMQMRAISSHFGLKESIRLGLNAGIDLFCFGNNLLPEAIELSQLVRVVTELINEGEISEERIFHSYRKITEAKKHE
ncbi:MAG: glycoside hydrolase family 3 N-terminal domain-containing protein, partial [Bacteroidota bacterium]